ncbi:MAG: hypothetical protein M1824_000948 [Vezdaea acicularis]|nr:MAG: hypothetical protein M1824_000948 [Vezdaea acicularis]
MLTLPLPSLPPLRRPSLLRRLHRLSISSTHSTISISSPTNPRHLSTYGPPTSAYMPFEGVGSGSLLVSPGSSSGNSNASSSPSMARHHRHALSISPIFPSAATAVSFTGPSLLHGHAAQEMVLGSPVSTVGSVLARGATRANALLEVEEERKSVPSGLVQVLEPRPEVWCSNIEEILGDVMF